MIPILIFAAAVATTDSLPPIIVNAALLPQPADQSFATVSVIDADRLQALGAPLVTDLLRLTPGLAVAVSGGPGSFAQVRIRGAEANHTLLFIDGIDFNDPASGDEPRFESLTSNGLERISVIRGPQSAIFGSEALGGVIQLDSPDPLGRFRASATAQYGSLDTRQAGATVSSGGEVAGITASVNWIKSDGIDILGGGHGDLDGYENKTASFKAIARPGDSELGLVGRIIDYRDDFDGVDPSTFLRADTRDRSHATTKALRSWATIGRASDDAWSGTFEVQYLTSDNKNFNASTPLNTTSGDRLRLAAQGVSRFSIGGSHHNFILRVERQQEHFHGTDIEFGGLTGQRRQRNRTTVVGEWQAKYGTLLDTDLAVRHDAFSDFADATTVRAGAVLHLGSQLALTASYGDGISEPTFYDLFGFFPGSFVGNPNLKPERSRGYEVGIRWRSRRLDLTADAFSNQLRDEIVDTFDTTTFLSSTANATGHSRRRGIELSGEWRPINGLDVDADYTYLDATQQTVAGTAQVAEVRRPKHSANLSATYTKGRLTLGASAAYVGKRTDTDFDIFKTVTLHSYVLASARIGYRLLPQVELFLRADNLGNAHYQDVVGYATAGRTVYGGVRVTLGE